MIKWIIILILLLFPVAGLSIWYSSGNWIEGEDKLCGETVHYYAEGRIEPYMPSVTGIGGGGWLSADMKREMYLEAKISTGPKCYAKYKDEFNKLIQDWIAKKRVENAELITKHREERRLRDVKQKEKRIKHLQRELKELERE